TVSVNEGGAARRRCAVAPMPMPASSSTIVIDERMARPLKLIARSSELPPDLTRPMRVYPRPPTGRDVIRWLEALPRTERASTVLVLAGAGLVLTSASCALARGPDRVLPPPTFPALFTVAWLAYACGALVTLRIHARLTVVVILTVGVLSRALMLPALPSLSTDAYRYVWDARVASAGVDPYAYAPAAPEVAGLRDANIYPHLNHSTWRTVYPPVAQALFLGVYRFAPDNVFALKVA